MSVDAVTYLFNLLAERIKNRPFSKKELAMVPQVRAYRRERLRLYLELIPPLISVVTLLLVTLYSTQDAIEDLTKGSDEREDDVNVNVMLTFSAANLILDFVNVTCFARANQTFGLSTTVREHEATTRSSYRDVAKSVEMDRLLDNNDEDIADAAFDSSGFPGEKVLVNLNMCSAWTVSFPLRSFCCFAECFLKFRFLPT